MRSKRNLLGLCLILVTSWFVANPLQAASEAYDPTNPYRASLYVTPEFNHLGIALEWRWSQVLSVAYIHKQATSRSSQADQNNIDRYEDKGLDLVELRFWPIQQFYLSLGSMRSYGYSEYHYHAGDYQLVGDRIVQNGNFTVSTQVEPGYSLAFGLGGQSILLILEHPIILWSAITWSLDVTKGDVITSTTSSNVTEEDLQTEAERDYNFFNGAYASRMNVVLLSIGYSF